jgi:hypothetical protein
MDEQKPLWRTAWYWKQICLYLLIPLNIVLATFAALARAGHISVRQFDRITTIVGTLGVVACTMWINHQAKKRAVRDNP